VEYPAVAVNVERCPVVGFIRTPEGGGLSPYYHCNWKDDWTKLGSVDAETWVYNTDDDVKSGFIEQFTEVYKNTSEKKSDTNDYGVTQHGFTQPAHDHSWGKKAHNERTKQIQNWKRSELSPNHLSHSPVKDKKSSFDTNITAGYGAGGITMSYNVPYIRRDVEYLTEEQVQTLYYYPQNPAGHEAKYVDCDHEQISIWRTDPISSDSEQITTSYYHGLFKEFDGIEYGDSAFNMLTLHNLQK
jgi:hypothetical protein